MAGETAGSPTELVLGASAGQAAAASTGEEPRSIPVLEPAPGGPAERVATTIGSRHPVRVFLVTVVAGYAALVALTVAAGLVLTDLVVPAGGFEEWDNGINRWFVARRDPTSEDLSWVGSTLAGGLVIPVVVGVLLGAFLLRRKWLLAAVTLFLIAVESGSYRATTLVVHRDRPPVDRLESLPPDASYPSGHTAASIALYGGLLLLAASWVRRTWFSVLAGAVAIAIALFVAWARTYRGMHHVTDIAAGAVIGLITIAVVVFAARAATAAASTRDEERA